MDSIGSTNGEDNDDGLIDSIGIPLGILILLIVICIGSYFFCSSPSTVLRRSQAAQLDSSGGLYNCCDTDFKARYPKVVYSEVKKAGCSTSCSCSICLEDYDDTDMLRLLPQCGHLFHLACIDPWLLVQPTCPVCRSSPVAPSSPIISTPLAEVAALAAADSSPV